MRDGRETGERRARDGLGDEKVLSLLVQRREGLQDDVPVGGDPKRADGVVISEDQLLGVVLGAVLVLCRDVRHRARGRTPGTSAPASPPSSAAEAMEASSAGLLLLPYMSW